ncbi:861_t:CDS:10 [Entrophospora sp. SA101]|nr:861_t:CDS:10 [Entrophospora sp. SA101]
MSSAVSRAKTRRQEANLTPRTQILPNSVPSSANHHNNNHNHNNNNNMNNHNNNINNNNHPPISSGPNSYKPIEQVVYDEIASRHMHDRMLFLFSNLVGMNVVVTLKSGVKYQGFFRTACTDGEMGVVLRLARRILSKNEEKTTPNPAKESFIILAKDLMDIHATNVDFFASERPSFERDKIRERELHKWTPDESGENILENGDNSWDQFEVNRQLFGITTDFNEEIYTTKLDRSKPDFKEREKAAIALANEINRTTTTNVHMLEERGHIIDESQIDEEQLYGAVARRDPSKYMPPAIQEIKPSSPDNNNNKSEPLSNGTTTTTVTNTTATTNKSTAPVQKVNSLAKFRITEPIEVLLTKRNNNNQSSEGKKIETQMETQIVKTFRQFANNEKERLQQRKQAIFKKEMDGKVAELLKWESSVPAGMIIKGLNFYKDGSDPITKLDNEYPDWLWELLDEEIGTIEHLDGLLLLSSIKNQNDKTKGKKAAKVVANNITKVVAVEKDQVDKKVDELEISTTNDLTANNGPATDVATSSDQINGSVEIINSDEDSDDDKDRDKNGQATVHPELYENFGKIFESTKHYAYKIMSLYKKEIEEHIIKEYEPNLIWLDEHKGDSLLYYKIKLTITWKLNSENILANSLLKK